MGGFVIRIAIVVALIGLVTSGVGGSPPASAAEPVTTVLPNGYGGMVVDAAHTQVFVSSPTSGTITALDFSGAVLGTITGEAGPGSMVVHGDKLYVALRNGGAIDVFDTATRARTTTLAQGLLVQPGPLVWAGNKLWTSTGACSQWQVQLASVDPTTGAVKPFTVDSGTTLPYCAALAGSPWDPNALFGWGPGLSPTTLSRFDVSTGSPVLAVSQWTGTNSNTADLAVNPDGTTFVVASGSPYQFNEYRVSDLQPDGVVYPSGAYPNSVATTAAQGGLIAAGRFAWYENDIDVYRAGQPGVDLFTYDFGTTSDVLYARGLAFSSDGSKLFAVTGDGTTVHFHVFDLGAPGQGSSAGELTPLTPARLLDTRTSTGGHPGKLGPGQSFDLQVTGQGGVPGAGVSAVVLNVTATDPTAASYLSVWPTGTPRPTVSNVNYAAGATVPNLVTVKVGTGGRVTIVNDAGQTNVVVDVVGFYADASGPAGSRFHGLAPSRLFDTRNGTGGVVKAKRGPGSTLHVKVTGIDGVPSTGTTAVVLNVTATEPTAASFLTVYPDDVSRPVASNLNVVSGQTVPNLVVVRVPASGIVDFYNNAGSTHLLADVVGYYDGDKSTDAGRLIAGSPQRLVDTRLASPFPAPGRVPGGASLLLDFSQSPNVAQIGGFVLNVTVTGPTAPGHLIVYPGPPPPPSTSSLNFVPGLTVANAAAVRIGADGTVGFYNSAGATHLVVDLFGIFTTSGAASSTSVDPGEISATLRAG
jgi:hypothetical protein